jgi:hypothetical protein
MRCSRAELWRAAFIGWFAVAAIVLVAYTLCQNRPLFWDEVPYLSRATALSQSGSFKAWLLDNDAVAAGPAHALMNFALSGGRGTLPVPWIRLPNLLLMFGCIAFTASALRRRGVPAVFALAILSIPMVWVVSGMAISESLGLFAIAGCLVGALGFREAQSARERLQMVTILISGAAVATTTRQLYVVALPGVALIAARSWRDGIMAIAIIAVSVLPLLVLVALWGGLVPPKQAFVGSGISLQHGFLGLALIGVSAALLAPRVYLEAWKHAALAAAVAVGANEWWHWVRPTTLTSVQRFVTAPTFWRVTEHLLGDLFVAAGAAFATTVLAVILRSRDAVVWGAGSAVAAIGISCATVTHQFSSRYAVLCLPFLVVLLGRWMRIGPGLFVRMIFGSMIGLAILHSYYRFA